MAFGRVIETSIGPAGGTGITVRDLRISFVIEKTDASSANKAEISIYNLTRDSATRYGKVGNKIIIRAGYEDEGAPRSIFFGDITRALYKTEGVDRILEIEAYDGQAAAQDVNVSLSYTAGTPVNQVVSDIVHALGLPLASPFVGAVNIYATGFSFIGKAKDALTESLSRIGQIWTIQNEQIVIYTDGGAVIRTGLLLSPSSGLIQVVEELEDKSTDQVTTDVPKRYTANFLLDGRVLPGSEIQISSTVASGTFRVESVVFSGDNFEGDFLGTAEVSAL